MEKEAWASLGLVLLTPCCGLRPTFSHVVGPVNLSILLGLIEVANLVGFFWTKKPNPYTDSKQVITLCSW